MDYTQLRLPKHRQTFQLQRPSVSEERSAWRLDLAIAAGNRGREEVFKSLIGSVSQKVVLENRLII